MSTICVDFDGTCVEHAYPEIGELVPHAVRVLQKFKEDGHTLILYTMRSGIGLALAISFMGEQGVVFDHVNANPSQKDWTNSQKVYADWYIDDVAAGCPLTSYPGANRAYVDWLRIEEMYHRKWCNDGG